MRIESEKVTLNSGNIELAGNVYKSSGKNPYLGVVFLHGGGSASKERFSPLQQSLAEKNVASIALDFRGVGESKGAFEEGGISKRVEDANTACNYILEKFPIKKLVVSGASMGGAVALDLLETRSDIDGFILISPAAYAKGSHETRLGEEFRSSIRRKNSWATSPSFDLLKRFQGPVVIIYGENDTVIPDAIKNLYKNSLNPSGKFVEIKKGTHTLLNLDPKLNTLPEAFTEVKKTIEEFITQIPAN